MGPQEKEANVGYEHKREKREREGRKDGGKEKEKVTEEVAGGNNTSRHLSANCEHSVVVQREDSLNEQSTRPRTVLSPWERVAMSKTVVGRAAVIHLGNDI